MKIMVARLRRGLHRFGLAQNSGAPFINIVALVALDLETLLAGSRIQKDRGSKGTDWGCSTTPAGKISPHSDLDRESRCPVITLERAS